MIDKKKTKTKTKTGAKKSPAAAEAKKKKDISGIKASARGVRISPRKARLVVNMIKGKQVEPALQILRSSAKKAGVVTAKLLQSAISNAVEASSLDADRLWVQNAWVSMGKTLNRYMPRAQGRATPIRKRSSHITVVLVER